MEIQNLEAFLCVAKLESFSSAADILHITQSSVTLRIKALEKELGLQLFIRNSRKVELSNAGREILPFVKEALRLLELGRQKLKNIEPSKIVRLTVATTHTTNARVIPELMSVMNRKWPDVRINVLTGRTNFVIEKLLSGEAQVGLLRTPLPHVDLYYKRLFDEDLVMAVSNQSPVGDDDTIDIKSLHGLNMIAFDSTTSFGQWLKNLFVSKGIEPRIIIENDYLPTIKQMVIEGIGAAILPLSTVENEVRLGLLKVLRITGAGKLVRSVVAVCEKNKLNSSEVSAFLTTLSKIHKNKSNINTFNLLNL